MMLLKQIIKKENLLEFSILFFALFPLIPNKVKGLPVILLLILSFFFINKIKFKDFIIYSGLFIIYLISLIYTKGNFEAYKLLETSLSILIFPLVFKVFLNDYKFSKSLKLKFCNLFILSTFIFSIIVIVGVFTDNQTVYYSNWYTNKFRTIIRDFPIIGQHPIYSSLFFSISLFLSVHLIRLKNNNIYYFFIFFNVLALLLFLSKGVLFALFISLMLYFKYNFKFTKKTFVLLITGLLMFLSLFFFNRRMKELIDINTYTKVDTNYSTGLRVGIYSCVLKLINEKWVVGYGVGNTQKVLDSCYKEESPILLENKYNSHNQYFDITLKSGIYGLVYFVFFLSYLFYNSKKEKKFLLNCILLFFIIVFMVENLLLRQTGVILFYFIITFFNCNFKDVSKFREI